MEERNRRFARPGKKKRHLRWGRVILLLVVLAVLLTTAFWATVWAYDNLINPPATKTVGADDKIVTDAALNKRINVLLLGIDDGDSEADVSEPKRTDAIIVASFDPSNNEVSLLSVPRDTRVILPGHSSWEKINAAYAYGGVAMTKQTVANLLRIPIHYYALVNWQGFIDVINLIGGVDLYVERDMYYEDPYADLKIDIKHGYQHLDGQRSGEYVRFRKDELGDIGRVQRQQKFLKALGMEMFSINNIAKIPQIVATIDKYLETDMTTMTMLKAAKSFKILDDNKVKSGMLYGDFDDSTGISYWRTSRSLISKSLDEVGIPYMHEEEDAIVDDPTVGSEFQASPLQRIEDLSNREPATTKKATKDSKTTEDAKPTKETQNESTGKEKSSSSKTEKTDSDAVKGSPNTKGESGLRNAPKVKKPT